MGIICGYYVQSQGLDLLFTIEIKQVVKEMKIVLSEKATKNNISHKSGMYSEIRKFET